MVLYFITGNEHKLKEARSILGKIESLKIDLPEIQSLDSREVITSKLMEARKYHPGRLFCEDVSLSLECLNGLPGPLIKWFLKALGREGIVRLTQQYGNPKAEVKALIGYSDGREIKFFEGAIQGRIVPVRAESPFGFDPIFQPDNHQKTFAEMSEEEKNSISHRRLALEKMKIFLENGN